MCIVPLLAVMKMHYLAVGMVNQKEVSNVADNCFGSSTFVDAGSGNRFYDGFVHPHSHCNRGCPAGDQSQSRGDDQSEDETCIAKSRRKTGWQADARAISRPAGAVTEYALRCKMGKVPLSGFVDSRKAIDEADEIVRSVKGVKSVKNDLIAKWVKEEYYEIRHAGPSGRHVSQNQG